MWPLAAVCIPWEDRRKKRVALIRRQAHRRMVATVVEPPDDGRGPPPRCLARYVTTWRLKQAGCALPRVRVGPKRAETAASMAASDKRRRDIELVTHAIVAILGPFRG